MICPNCKTEIEEGCLFCPNCGCSLETQENLSISLQPNEGTEAPKKTKKGLIFGICALVIAAIAAAVFLFWNDPLVSVEKAVIKTSEVYNKKLQKMKQPLGVSVSYDLASVSEELTGVSLPASIDMSLALDAEDKLAALQADVTVKDTSFIDLSGWYGDDSIVLRSPVLCGDTFGINLSDMAKNLPGSFLDPEQGYVDQELYDDLLEIAENYGSAADLNKDVIAVIKNVGDVAVKSLKKNCQAEKSRTEVDFGGENLKLSVVTVEINAEQLASIASDTIGYIKTDFELRDDLNRIAEDYDSVCEALIGESAQELLRELYDSLDEFNSNEFLQEHSPKELVLVIRFTINNSGELVGVKAAYSPENVRFDFQCGPDASEPVYTYLALDSYFEDISLRYVVNENSESRYASELTVKANDSLRSGVSVEWDKVTGDFSMQSDGAEFSAEVKQEGGVTTIIPYGVAGEDFEEINDYINKASITLDREPEFPAIPVYEDILTLSPGEIDEIAEEIEQSAQALVFSLYSYLF